MNVRKISEYNYKSSSCTVFAELQFLNLSSASVLSDVDDGIAGPISIPGGFPLYGGTTQYSVYVSF